MDGSRVIDAIATLVALYVAHPTSRQIAQAFAPMGCAIAYTALIGVEILMLVAIWT